uniref:Uncharacterized protein n=1 Tax=Tanacetum cinerariifolium TaxID=118510 RepID=A0A699L775_TANCI|nr:hypothetical protein [Tanacetum cinerariifolium]
MRDTMAQTRFDSISKYSNDSLLVRGNEIASLKRRVKKLEKKNMSRTHELKRLYKVGLTARVESSDEESLGEDASKQERRIDAIDQDEDITLLWSTAMAKTINGEAQIHARVDGKKDKLRKVLA